MPKSQLVDVPVEKTDQLALLNELVAKREEEAEELRVRLSNLRHSITQERIQWEEQRRQEENALQIKQLQRDQEYTNRLGELDAIARARHDALDQAEKERQAVIQDRVQLMEDRKRLQDLNRERVEIERLRAAVVNQQQELSQRASQAQTDLNTATSRLEEADKKFEEVERRTAQLSRLHAELQTRQEELDIRAKHLNIVQETVGQIVEKLPIPQAPLIPELPLVPIPTPPPAPESLPMPPANLSDMEIAPQALSTSEEAEVSTPPPSAAENAAVQSWMDRHSPHPSQRSRVYDPSKPINDQ